jgi:hypothetical protein
VQQSPKGLAVVVTTRKRYGFFARLGWTRGGSPGIFG